MALELFEKSHDRAVGTNRILPFVLRAMKDADPRLSKYASEFLAGIAPAAGTNSTAH